MQNFTTNTDCFRRRQISTASKCGVWISALSARALSDSTNWFIGSPYSITPALADSYDEYAKCKCDGRTLLCLRSTKHWCKNVAVDATNLQRFSSLIQVGQDVIFIFLFCTLLLLKHPVLTHRKSLMIFQLLRKQSKCLVLTFSPRQARVVIPQQL